MSDYRLEIAKKTLRNGILEASEHFENSSPRSLAMIEAAAKEIIAPLSGNTFMIEEALGPFFFEAATLGRPDANAKLIELGAHPNWKNDKGYTAAQYLIDNGRGDLVMDLICSLHMSEVPANEILDFPVHAHHVEKIAPPKKGATCLHLAVHKTDASAVIDLLEIGVNTQALDAHGQTPLMLAVERYSPSNGNTPANQEHNKNALTIIDALLDDECKLNHRNYEGRTALCMAAEGGKTEAFKRILEAHERESVAPYPHDLSIALALAIKGNHHDMMRMAVQAGANPCGKLGENEMEAYVNRNTTDGLKTLQLLSSLKTQYTVNHVITENPEATPNESTVRQARSQLSL